MSKIQLPMLNRFLVTTKSINFAANLSKWPSKNKDPTRARAKSQLIFFEVPVSVTRYFFKMVTVTVT